MHDMVWVYYWWGYLLNTLRWILTMINTRHDIVITCDQVHDIAITRHQVPHDSEPLALCREPAWFGENASIATMSAFHSVTCMYPIFIDQLAARLQLYVRGT